MQLVVDACWETGSRAKNPGLAVYGLRSISAIDAVGGSAPARNRQRGRRVTSSAVGGMASCPANRAHGPNTWPRRPILHT